MTDEQKRAALAAVINGKRPIVRNPTRTCPKCQAPMSRQCPSCGQSRHLRDEAKTQTPRTP